MPLILCFVIKMEKEKEEGEEKRMKRMERKVIFSLLAWEENLKERKFISVCFLDDLFWTVRLTFSPDYLSLKKNIFLSFFPLLLSSQFIY